MQYLIAAIVGIIVSFVLYKIAASLFSEGYGNFISGCYLAAFWPFIIFVILAYFFPVLIGNERWGYFLIYAPLLTILYLPFTILPVIIAHIACKIRYRGYIKPNEQIDKLWWTTVVLYLVILLISLFIFPVFYLLGMLLVVVVSIYRIIRKIKQKIKERPK